MPQIATLLPSAPAGAVEAAPTGGHSVDPSDAAAPTKFLGQLRTALKHLGKAIAQPQTSAQPAADQTADAVSKTAVDEHGKATRADDATDDETNGDSLPELLATLGFGLVPSSLPVPLAAESAPATGAARGSTPGVQAHTTMPLFQVASTSATPGATPDAAGGSNAATGSSAATAWGELSALFTGTSSGQPATSASDELIQLIAQDQAQGLAAQARPSGSHIPRTSTSSGQPGATAAQLSRSGTQSSPTGAQQSTAGAQPFVADGGLPATTHTSSAAGQPSTTGAQYFPAGTQLFPADAQPSITAAQPSIADARSSIAAAQLSAVGNPSSTRGPQVATDATQAASASDTAASNAAQSLISDAQAFLASAQVRITSTPVMAPFAQPLFASALAPTAGAQAAVAGSAAPVAGAHPLLTAAAGDMPTTASTRTPSRGRAQAADGTSAATPASTAAQRLLNGVFLPSATLAQPDALHSPTARPQPSPISTGTTPPAAETSSQTATSTQTAAAVLTAVPLPQPAPGAPAQTTPVAVAPSGVPIVGPQQSAQQSGFQQATGDNDRRPTTKSVAAVTGATTTLPDATFSAIAGAAIPIGSASPPISPQAAAVVSQIANQADLYRLPGNKGLRIQLHPDDLGGVQVTLRYTPLGGVELHIDVEQAATGSLVQAGWTQLHDALVNQGISPDRLIMSITSAGNAGQSDLSGNGNRSDPGFASFSQNQAQTGQFGSQGQAGQQPQPHTGPRGWTGGLANNAPAPENGRPMAAATAAQSRIDYRA